MNICSFNVNSVRARKDLILNWLDQNSDSIDILLFQELKTINTHFPFSDFQESGYKCAVLGQKAYNGVSICSKFPLSNICIGGLSEELDAQKRLISAVIEDLSIINIYAPHGGLPRTEKYNYKLKWYHAFFDYLKKNFHPGKPLIIGGDFNIAFQDIDVFSPDQLEGTIGTLPEERALMNELFDFGLIDIFRHMNPEKKEFTWWDYKTAAIWRNEGMRIDYFLCTPPILSKIEKIKIDLWPRRRRIPTPSDHAPLILSIE